MFCIFRQPKKRRKCRKLRDLRMLPEGLEPSTHGLRDRENVDEISAFYRRKSVIFNELDQTGFVLLHCNSLKNMLCRSAKTWA